MLSFLLASRSAGTLNFIKLAILSTPRFYPKLDKVTKSAEVPRFASLQVKGLNSIPAAAVIQFMHDLYLSLGLALVRAHLTPLKAYH